MANQTLTTEVSSVLQRAAINGNHLVVPNNPDGSRLDRGLYQQVDKALRNAGGKWNTKAQAHVFDSDPRQKLGLMLDTGVAIDEAGNRKKKLQAFYTPSSLARQLAQMADVRGKVVLEPSAGKGAIADALLDAGATQVVCVDIDPEAVAFLKLNRHHVIESDFLTLELPRTKFQRIVMNPPFTRDQDVEHVARAVRWLAPGGILVSVMLAKLRSQLSSLLDDCEWEMTDLPPKSFKESGTNIDTVAITVRRN